MNQQAELLLSDLDTTLARVSSARRSTMLRQVTDLLLKGELSYSREHLAVFDSVMQKLTRDVRPEALIELSARLASMDGAPADLVLRLSQSDDIAVCGPVLEKSNAFDDNCPGRNCQDQGAGPSAGDRRPGPHHRGRYRRPPRSGQPGGQVRCKVTANEGAEISERGFLRLQALVTKRKDIPPELEPFLKMAAA